MLEQLSKDDKTWRLFALKICKNKSLADDIVNDMYIKLHDSTKEIDKSYIYRVMLNIYNDYFREKKIKTVNIDDVLEIANSSNNTLNERYELLEMLKGYDIVSKEILLLTHEMSLRKAEEDCGIKYYVLKYHKNKLIKDLKKKYGTTKR